MPQDGADRVHTLACRVAANVALTFADRHGDIIPDDDDDADYIPDAAADNDDEADNPFDEDDDDDTSDDIGHISGVEELKPNATAVKPELNNDDDAIVDRNAAVEDQLNDEDVKAKMNQQYGERTAAYNLRSCRPTRDYGHMHAILEHTVMTQHKEFGDAGVHAVLSELQQLHARNVLVEPKDAIELPREEKRAALHYLMFLKKKHNDRIKGRGCADGRKQRLHPIMEDASSPSPHCCNCGGHALMRHGCERLS